MTAATWSEQQLTDLPRLWADGLPSAEIGRRIGKSKNAILGKAHRLGLPDRPSPIPLSSPTRYRAGSKSKVVVIKRAPKVTLPSLAAPRAATPPKLTVVRPVMQAPPPKPPTPMPSRYRDNCCWVLGDNKPWRYCDAPAVDGKPYCADHAKAAYVPKRDVAA
jgi:GcrA cell cycle regulator